MKTKNLKKIMMGLFIFTILSASSLEIFSYAGVVPLGATDAPEVLLDNGYSNDMEVDVPTKPIDDNQATSNNIVDPTLDSESIDTPTSDVSTTSNDVTIDKTTSNPLANSDTLQVATDVCVDPIDVDDPIFIEPSISIFVPEGGFVEDYYHPQVIDYDPQINLQIIMNGFKNDGSSSPGHYVLYGNATDNSCNTTGTDDGVGVNNPNQTINVTVLPAPTINAYHSDFSTKVNLEFEYDLTLYPDDAVISLYVFDENLATVDAFTIESGTYEYIYDQENYENYTYLLEITSETTFTYVDSEYETIQLPKINSFNATIEKGSKMIKIDYNISLNDFPNALAYIEFNGEKVVILDPNKTSITYAVPGYGTHDIALVLEYSDGADPLKASTSVKFEEPPIILAYTGVDTSIFENFILTLQDFISNIYR